MIITLNPKKEKFSAAHSLPCFGPDHPCAFEHGHTWWAEAWFRGEPKDGVLIPYEVRAIVKRLDHAFLDVGEHETERIAALDALGIKIKPAPETLGIPTGENILAWLAREFHALAVKWSCEVVRVELTEDPIPGDGHILVWQLSDQSDG